MSEIFPQRSRPKQDIVSQETELCGDVTKFSSSNQPSSQESSSGSSGYQSLKFGSGSSDEEDADREEKNKKAEDLATERKVAPDESRRQRNNDAVRRHRGREKKQMQEREALMERLRTENAKLEHDVDRLRKESIVIRALYCRHILTAHGLVLPDDQVICPTDTMAIAALNKKTVSVSTQTTDHGLPK